MSWRLFLDDERFPANDGLVWEICRNLAEVKQKVSEKGLPTYISFDHDLGDNEPTGYDVVKYLVDLDLDGILFWPENFDYYVHSQNPVGKKNIESYLNNFLKMKRD